MKYIFFILIILQIGSCVSTKKVAESRNSDFQTHNHYEFFKIWREIDIVRFNSNILNVRIGIIPENKTISEFKSDSLLVNIYDSLHVFIEEKMNGYQEFQKTYFDTTDRGKYKIYQKLKSDSADAEFLDKIANNPYFELYEDIIKRLRTSIQQSTFYASQNSFEEYLHNRSIEIVDLSFLNELFGGEKLSVKNLSENIIKNLKKNQINFIIAFSGSYNVVYSDRARGRVGSQNMNLTLFDIQFADSISSANITHFWGSE